MSLDSHFNLLGDLFSSINSLLACSSQAVYSAFGTFEAFPAHWRVKQCGLPAPSSDLPIVGRVDYVAETAVSEKLRRSLIKAGHRPIEGDHVLLSLESSIQAPYNPQLAVAIKSGSGPHWELDGGLGRDPPACLAAQIPRAPESCGATATARGSRKGER